MQYEYLVSIDGQSFGMDKLISINLTHPLFATYGIGNACSAQLSVSYVTDQAPQGLVPVLLYYRPADSDEAWTLRGTYLVAETSYKNYYVSIVAYDYMLKTELPFLVDGTSESQQWPRSMASVAAEIATAIGVTLDSRTSIPATYQQVFPLDYTMRELLCHIAAACGGNWIITAQNQLLLVPLGTSMPEETFHLVTEHGKALLIGGVIIRT